MKKVNIIDLDNVYKDIIKNVKNKRRIYEFEKYKLEYLTLCADIINEGNYKGGYYNIFIKFIPHIGYYLFIFVQFCSKNTYLTYLYYIKINSTSIELYFG